MKSTLFITSSQNNLYIYDFLKRELFPIHPIIRFCYELDQKGELENMKQHEEVSLLNCSDYQIDYYLNKYKILKSRGYFQSISKPEFISYTHKSIKHALCNVNNIVFEITNKCNLSCSYCINGPLYNARINYRKHSLLFNDLKATIDFFLPLWNSTNNNSPLRPITIGFYGGEPLLNFKTIKQIVEYCHNLNLQRIFKFSITTNATLLSKHIDYLVKNDFSITISLDGDKKGQSHRIFKNKENSFDVIYNVLKEIMNKYPTFWNKNISFNSVLHDKNDVNTIHQFILSEFDKVPEIHPLNNSGVRRIMKSRFDKMYRNYNYSILEKNNNIDHIKKERFTSDPEIFSLCRFLLWYGRNQYFDYETLLYAPNTIVKSSTGTCFPFSRKFYVTSDKRILVCEKINQKYELGRINENGKLEIDIDCIANKYNQYYQKMFANCKKCYMINGCNQCIFQLNDLDSPKPKCLMYKSEKDMIKYIKHHIDLLESNIVDYSQIINECIFS